MTPRLIAALESAAPPPKQMRRIMGCSSAVCDTCLLPHAASVLVDHRRASFAVEGFLEFRHVGDHAVGAVFFWRMRVDGSAQALPLVANVAAPALSVADEEALFGR